MPNFALSEKFVILNTNTVSVFDSYANALINEKLIKKVKVENSEIYQSEDGSMFPAELLPPSHEIDRSGLKNLVKRAAEGPLTTHLGGKKVHLPAKQWQVHQDLEDVLNKYIDVWTLKLRTANDYNSFCT